VISEPELLKRYQHLQRSGYEPVFEAGRLVARGFADLGFEEFCMLSSTKMVSLSTGSITELPDEHRRFFFEVPSMPVLVDLIDRAGFDLQLLTFVERRRWAYTMLKVSNGRQYSGEHRLIEGALLEALIVCLESEG